MTFSYNDTLDSSEMFCLLIWLLLPHPSQLMFCVKDKIRSIR